MVDYEIGQIEELIPTNVNFQLDFAPMVLVADPYVKDMNIWDTTLGITGLSASFRPDELVSQPATGARGIIQPGSNSIVLQLQQLRYYANQQFIPTVNATTKIYGDKTGSTANVVTVSMQGDVYPVGLNANVWSRASAFEGSVLGLKVVDSGFGYPNNEVIWFNKGTIHDSNTGYGTTQLGTSGKNQGFYEQKGGFLSDQKKLFDGYYYQNFSYEISSSKTRDKYLDMMKKIGHVAGTIMFSRYVYAKNINSISQQSTLDISII